LDDFSNPRRSTLDGINSNYQDKKNYIDTLKNELISEEDDFKKEKIKQFIKKAE